MACTMGQMIKNCIKVIVVKNMNVQDLKIATIVPAH